MKKILVICPTVRDRRELNRIARQRNLHIEYHSYTGIELEELLTSSQASHNLIPDHDQLIQSIIAQGTDLDGVISTDDYPGNIIASIVAAKLGLPGPSPKSILSAQHKYHARLIQQKSVPGTTPWFSLLDPIKIANADSWSFPVFAKPIKSSLSYGARSVASYQELENLCSTFLMPKAFLEPFAQFLKTYHNIPFDPRHLLVESLLEGDQVTLDGYVCNGNTSILGVVDSIMHPGTLSFARFQLPSKLSRSVQQRMGNIAAAIINALGLDWTMFNIEFMYNPINDQVHIIEINPRMSSQFADLYEKILGINSYQIMIDLALGNPPTVSTCSPQHHVAGSFVLRLFDDHLVKQIPTNNHIAHVHKHFPDARIEILATPGSLLSHYLQDSHSFRYALYNLGGNDERHLHEAFEQCKKLLPFHFDALPHSCMHK